MKKIAKAILRQSQCVTGLQSRFCVVLGLQWGNEGKGKLLDKLCSEYDYSVRFNGGEKQEPAILEDGQELKLLPFGIQHDTHTKCILGHGVGIEPGLMLSDFQALNDNGFDYQDKLIVSARCHLVTELHRKLANNLKQIRNDKPLLWKEDITFAFKPMKMGLRAAHLMKGSHGNFSNFVESYDRILKTSEQLFRFELTQEEREKDLDKFHRLYDIFSHQNKRVSGTKVPMIQDTLHTINSEMKKGKRFLVEDSSSTAMDVDIGIYPYTDSYNTTSGAVCIGLGIPDEAVETEIGVFSAISIIDRGILNKIKRFPSHIQPDVDPEYEEIRQKLASRYNISSEEFAIGWTDLNLVSHAERSCQLSSLFLTHLDALDGLSEIKICIGYETPEGKIVKGSIPATAHEFGNLKAKYEVLKGWQTDTTDIKQFDDLPTEAQTFIRFIEQQTRREVSYVSTCNDYNKGMLRTRLGQ